MNTRLRNNETARLEPSGSSRACCVLLPRVAPVEEDALFVCGHVTVKFANILARVDGVDNCHHLVVFLLELVDDGKFARFRSEQTIRTRELDAETPAPTVEVELFEVGVRVLFECVSAFPADRTRTGDVETMGPKILSQPHLVKLGQEEPRHLGIGKQLVGRSPAHEITSKLGILATEALRFQPLFSSMANDDCGTNATAQGLANEHCSSCQAPGSGP